jgi:hypothetical protein
MLGKKLFTIGDGGKKTRKEIKMREHTVMGQVEYKQYLAPKFHQEPAHLLHCPLLLSNERTLWVSYLEMTIVI